MSTLEKGIEILLQTSNSFMQGTKQSMNANTQAISRLEVQVGQLANALSERERGKFPSQPEPNLGVSQIQGQFQSHSSSSKLPSDQDNAITELRSGRQVDNGVTMPSEETTREPSKPNLEPTPSIPFPISEEKAQDPPEKTYVPLAPFPQRLRKNKTTGNMDKIFDVFKQVQVNIPLLDIISQVPTYAKFLKDLCTQKRTTHVPKKAFLAANISSIMSHQTPAKYKDPGCPTIPCVIGETLIEQALLDLGASVNLLPYSIYQQLGLCELQPTKVTLQLADRSVKVPKGIVEDVLIKVGEFVFPIDFIVLDTQPIVDIKVQIPITLG